MNSPSLCIPRINLNVQRFELENVFRKLNIGKIKRVDLAFKKNNSGDKYYSAFIHVIWNESDLSKFIIERITGGKDVKIVYDGLLFWKVFLNKSFHL